MWKIFQCWSSICFDGQKLYLGIFIQSWRWDEKKLFSGDVKLYNKNVHRLKLLVGACFKSTWLICLLEIWIRKIIFNTTSHFLSLFLRSDSYFFASWSVNSVNARDYGILCMQSCFELDIAHAWLCNEFIYLILLPLQWTLFHTCSILNMQEHFFPHTKRIL